LLQLEREVTAPANSATPVADVELAPLLAGGGMVLVELELHGDGGALLSRNFYWRGGDAAAYRALNSLPPAQLTITARTGSADGPVRRITVDLANTGTSPALAIKLTVLDKAGARVLPAYYDDNYVSLMPGEQRTVAVRVPTGAEPAAIGVRGWNAAEFRIALSPR
jgi:hypothetical protein